MGDANFNVTPQVLKAKMAEAIDDILKAEKQLSLYEDSVNKTRSCWLGDSGDKYRALVASFKPEVVDILQRWKSHISDLKEIAEIYEETEKSNDSYANALPNDVLI